MALPWLTSDDLIEAVKRNISFPITQDTFTADDLLSFANQEMTISQVPSILQFHEEYFVATLDVELEDDKSRYPVPQRAIGDKLRNLFFKDSNDNLSRMARINPDNKDQSQSDSSNGVYRYYLQGNDIVLVPAIETAPADCYLTFDYFQRPNLLVQNERAGTIASFSKTLTITNGSIVAGDTITFTVDGTATVLTAGTSYTVGATATLTGDALVTAITTAAVVSSVTNASGVLTIVYSDRNITIETSRAAAFAIQATIGLRLDDDIPDNITASSYVDLLQTRRGHKTLNISVLLGASALNSTTDTISIAEADVSEDIVVGDRICSEFECIIPQIPDDLHTGLVERVCSRILNSIGDLEHLQAQEAKVAAIDATQGTLIDQRVEGSAQKVVARNSILRWNKSRNRQF